MCQANWQEVNDDFQAVIEKTGFAGTMKSNCTYCCDQGIFVVSCPACNGNGIISDTPCPRCLGVGKIVIPCPVCITLGSKIVHNREIQSGDDSKYDGYNDC